MKDFAPSSQASWSTMSYPRERSDRRWVEFEASAPLEATWKSWAAAAGLVIFIAIVSFIS